MQEKSYVDWEGLSYYDNKIKNYIANVASSEGGIIPPSSDDLSLSYVDWQGLVYYDENIKEYVRSLDKGSIYFGGIVPFDQLPAPSEDNLHYIYKITTEFIATEDLFDIHKLFRAGTVVICVDSADGPHYSILCEDLNIDPRDYSTTTEVKSFISEAIKTILKTVSDQYVPKSDLFDDEVILICGNAQETIDQSVIGVILNKELPPVKGNLASLDLTPWEEITDLSSYPVDKDGVYIVDDVTLGYQIYFHSNENSVAQAFAIPTNVKIVSAYRFDAEGTHSWLKTDAPPSFEWVKSNKITVSVNEKSYEYDTYVYNVEDMGDAMLTNESWRFEFKEIL